MKIAKSIDFSRSNSGLLKISFPIISPYLPRVLLSAYTRLKSKIGKGQRSKDMFGVCQLTPTVSASLTLHRVSWGKEEAIESNRHRRRPSQALPRSICGRREAAQGWKLRVYFCSGRSQSLELHCDAIAWQRRRPRRELITYVSTNTQQMDCHHSPPSTHKILDKMYQNRQRRLKGVCHG